MILELDRFHAQACFGVGARLSWLAVDLGSAWEHGVAHFVLAHKLVRRQQLLK